jgi:hypothetical protein
MVLQCAAPVRWALGAVVLLILAACGAGTETPSLPEPGPPAIDRERATGAAWEALEPNTASHDRANWAVVEVRTVSGREVADEFEGWTYHGACGGPAPPPNGEIEPAETYWYVEMKPQPATPSGPSMSPTAPPLVPEPFMFRALFLIDESGQVIARMLACVVY